MAGRDVLTPLGRRNIVPREASGGQVGGEPFATGGKECLAPRRRDRAKKALGLRFQASSPKTQDPSPKT
jgi:hypothetical protein